VARRGTRSQHDSLQGSQQAERLWYGANQLVGIEVQETGERRQCSVAQHHPRAATQRHSPQAGQRAKRRWDGATQLVVWQVQVPAATIPACSCGAQPRGFTVSIATHVKPVSELIDAGMVPLSWLSRRIKRRKTALSSSPENPRHIASECCHSLQGSHRAERRRDSATELVAVHATTAAPTVAPRGIATAPPVFTVTHTHSRQASQ
jgi:hypothetical protein